MAPTKRLRCNKERFGYICGHPNGQIRLYKDSAADLISRSASIDELKPHLLENLDVWPGFYLDTPPLVWLEITRKCNMRCPHCYISAGDERVLELPTSKLKEILTQMSEMGVWAVAITGGEPTLHPDFVEIVNHAHKCGLLIGIATNGLLLSDDILRQIPTEGVIISISIDDLHNAGCGTNKNFQLATDTLSRCISLGFDVNIMTNTHRQNLNEIVPLMNWAETNDVSIRSVPFSPLGRGKNHPELANLVSDAHLTASFWLRENQLEHSYHKRVGLCVGVIFNYGLTLAYMTQRCSSGRFLCYVCSDGTVYPCTMCAGEEILSPGNLLEREFAELWRSEWKIREYSWNNFKSTCNGCIINTTDYYCAARCPAMSHARHGDLFSCGASEFEIQSTLIRTSLLNKTLSEHESKGISGNVNGLANFLNIL